ncbi:MAG: TrbC/VirB2 family protein [Candidatus Parcubacteria bacterium]|nr:TrbC/VirB2 family protein [Candidatus Parcubacteria bacterium]
MKKYIVILLLLTCLGLNLLPLAAFAQNEIQDGLIIINAPLGMPSGDLRVVISKIINQLMGFIGIAFVLIIIAGGFLYMFSMGDEVAAQRAKDTITQGIIGLVIIFCSYSIANFVINSIKDASMQ